MGRLSELWCSEMDEGDPVSQSLERSDGPARHTHAYGKVTEATTTRCGQDRGRAETPTQLGCQPADRTEDVPGRVQ